MTALLIGPKNYPQNLLQNNHSQNI